MTTPGNARSVLGTVIGAFSELHRALGRKFVNKGAILADPRRLGNCYVGRGDAKSDHLSMGAIQRGAAALPYVRFITRRTLKYNNYSLFQTGIWDMTVCRARTTKTTPHVPRVGERQRGRVDGQACDTCQVAVCPANTRRPADRPIAFDR